MASGSPTQERATDRQCSNCHRWFDARGIDAHEAHCDGEPDESRSESETIDEDSSAPTIFDPLAEQEPTETESETTMSETPDCPTCSSDAKVTTTEELQQKLAERDRLTKANLQKTRQNTHYCANCNEVFTDE